MSNERLHGVSAEKSDVFSAPPWSRTTSTQQLYRVLKQGVRANRTMRITPKYGIQYWLCLRAGLGAGSVRMPCGRCRSTTDGRLRGLILVDAKHFVLVLSPWITACARHKRSCARVWAGFHRGRNAPGSEMSRNAQGLGDNMEAPDHGP